MSDHKELVLPALRAFMGDWVYYVSTMKMADVAERVHFAKEIHKSELLQELLQRELDESKHAASIRDYLLRDAQRFFNAMVVGVYEGAPEWHELKARGLNKLAPNLDSIEFQGTLGFLRLNGAEQLFAIDGQHRVCGIKQAVKGKPALGKEEVTVIFVAHKVGDKGRERTRRLFTRLNRFAKPVRKEEAIVLDEDDVVAILTRQFVEDDKRFQGKIAISRTKALPASDGTSLTTIGTLYDCLDAFLSVGQEDWKNFKQVRPDDRIIKKFFTAADSLWRTLARNFPEVAEVLRPDGGKEVAAKYRNRNGGHLLFRPIGLLLVVRTISELIDSGFTLSRACRQVARVPMKLVEKPWAGLLWDVTNGRMMTAGENQKAASKLLYVAAGGKAEDLGTTVEDICKEAAGILNISPSGITLSDLLQ